MKIILLGGSGEVGRAVANALLSSTVCSQLTMIGRRAVDAYQEYPKVHQIVTDTNAPNFETTVLTVARGHEVGISCLGIGSGTAKMSEAQMMDTEVILLGKFARGCKAAGVDSFELLTAAGVGKNSAHSRIKYLRVLGKKLNTVLDVGFQNLAVFKPGMIVGNAHTPKWMTYITALIPDKFGFGNIYQEELARAFVSHLEKGSFKDGGSIMFYGNKEMKKLIGR